MHIKSYKTVSIKVWKRNKTFEHIFQQQQQEKKTVRNIHTHTHKHTFSDKRYNPHIISIYDPQRRYDALHKYSGSQETLKWPNDKYTYGRMVIFRYKIKVPHESSTKVSENFVNCIQLSIFNYGLHTQCVVSCKIWSWTFMLEKCVCIVVDSYAE